MLHRSFVAIKPSRSVATLQTCRTCSNLSGRWSKNSTLRTGIRSGRRAHRARRSAARRLHSRHSGKREVPHRPRAESGRTGPAAVKSGKFQIAPLHFTVAPSREDTGNLSRRRLMFIPAFLRSNQTAQLFFPVRPLGYIDVWIRIP